jgi:hypothetical protein
MFVSSVIEEARNAVGKCDNATVFRRITDAVRLANNSGKFDANIAVMDICVCNGCATLPADVATVLAVNVDGQPSLIRDQWFQFNVNGPGIQKYVPYGYSDEQGLVSTYRDPSGPVKFVAQLESALDSGKSLRVFGWDADGKRVYSPGPSGVLEDGVLVPTVFGFSQPNPAAGEMTRIDRVQKDETNGFIKLVAVNSDTLTSHTTIGYYLPWETNPSYRRIRVPGLSWLRIKYRKKDLEVRGLNDWINIENRQALLLLVKSVKYSLENALDQAANFEQAGMKLLSNEAEAMRPPGMSGPQIVFEDGLPAGPSEGMYY